MLQSQRMKNAVWLLSIVAILAGCSGKDTSRLPVDTREMVYDMLALPPLGRASAVAVTATADDFELQLDQVVVSGLDDALRTWSELVRGAKIRSVRHTVTGNTDASVDRLIDSGRVVLTLQERPSLAPRDTTMTFVATWQRTGGKWYLRKEAISRRELQLGIDCERQPG